MKVTLTYRNGSTRVIDNPTAVYQYDTFGIVEWSDGWLMIEYADGQIDIEGQVTARSHWQRTVIEPAWWMENATL